VYAVITIAPVAIGETPGFSGKLQGSFETKRGNSDVDNYSGGIRAQYDNNETYVLWGDFTFSYAKAFGALNTNKTYSHLRYIHTFYTKPLNAETLVQTETNEFTRVKKRFLAGGGLRYHFDKGDYGNLYFGLGAFFENISYTTSVDPGEKNIRINSYIAYTKQFSKESKLSYVGYFQPNAEYSSDYIVSNGLELEVLVYKQLYVNFVLYYDIDTQPAVGVKGEDITQKTSFVYKF